MSFDRRWTRFSGRSEAAAAQCVCVCVSRSLIDITCCSLVSGRWTGGCAAALISYPVSPRLVSQHRRLKSVRPMFKSVNSSACHTYFSGGFWTHFLLGPCCFAFALLQLIDLADRSRKWAVATIDISMGTTTKCPPTAESHWKTNTWLCHIWSFHWLTTQSPRWIWFSFWLLQLVVCMFWGANLDTLF